MTEIDFIKFPLSYKKIAGFKPAILFYPKITQETNVLLCIYTKFCSLILEANWNRS